MDIDKIIQDDNYALNPFQNNSTHKEPLIIERGEGVWIYSITGEKIMDAFSGMWNVNVGYGNKELAQAAYEQMVKIAYGSNFSGSSTLPQIQLAKKLSGYAYENLHHTFFTCGGSEANESAFKTAQYYWKQKGKPSKYKFICLENAYHGMTMAAASATGMSKFWNVFNTIPGFIHIPNPNQYRYEGDIRQDESVGRAAARALEEAIIKEGADNIAGFISEPIQGSGGGIIPPDDYFPAVREICNKYEILMIADEVITGFGRTGEMFALNHWGVSPDIVTFAKGVTSGYLPLGGMQVTDEINSVIENAPPESAWLHGYTYSGHAASCSVALKNIELIERNNLLDNVKLKERRFMAELKVLSKYECIGDIRGIGLLHTIEFVTDCESKGKNFQLAGEVYNRCLKNGLRLRMLGNNISIAPPFIISDNDVDYIINTLERSLKECI